ncbi:MAG: hypothetical protein Q9213_002629 [Squamulea squamosa]
MVQSSSLLALAGLIAYISARPSLGPRVEPSVSFEGSFEGIATFNDYSFQLETQGSTVCGGSESLQPPGIMDAHLTPSLTPGLPALMPDAAQQHATRSKTLVLLGLPKEKLLAAQPCRSLTAVLLVARGTTGKQFEMAVALKEFICMRLILR